jgi:hypothetical protein
VGTGGGSFREPVKRPGIPRFSGPFGLALEIESVLPGEPVQLRKGFLAGKMMLQYDLTLRFLCLQSSYITESDGIGV